MVSCQKHPEHGLEFYCKQWKVLVCSRCLFFQHNGHQLCLLEDTLEVLMAELDELDKYYSNEFSEDSNSETNDKKLMAAINTIGKLKI